MLPPRKIPSGCLMGSLEDHLYFPPKRSRTASRTLWKRLWHIVRRDDFLLSLPHHEIRLVRDVFYAVYDLRDFVTGICTATVEAIAERAACGVTRAKRGLKVLWMIGLIERIPRRRQIRTPEGKRRWVQTSTVTEPRHPNELPRWPRFAAENSDVYHWRDTRMRAQWEADRCEAARQPHPSLPHLYQPLILEMRGAGGDPQGVENRDMPGPKTLVKSGSLDNTILRLIEKGMLSPEAAARMRGKPDG